MVFYALGYRLPGNATTTLPVGVLIIETNPKRADISLNDQFHGRSPKAISNLKPAQTIVSVSKDGFAPWHKNITIAPGEVTELRSIRLFPADQSLRTLLSDVVSFSLSPNRKLIAVTTSDNYLHIIDTKGLDIAKPIIINPLPQQLLWSPDSNSLLAISGAKASAVDITEQPLSVSGLPGLIATSQLAWDQRVPGRLLTVTPDQNLIAYHVATKASELIYPNVSRFATSSRYIYIVDTDNQILMLNLQGALVDSPNIAYDQPIKQLHVTPDGHAALQFADSSVSLLTAGNKLLPIANHAKKLGWSPDGQLLYLQTEDSSVHVFNAYDERLPHMPLYELKLITRLSRPIRNPQWFAGGKHLIYQVNDEIFITEIDTRDYPINYTVDTTNLGDSNITVGAHGDTILYVKKTGQHNRLVSADLTVTEE